MMFSPDSMINSKIIKNKTFIIAASILFPFFFYFYAPIAFQFPLSFAGLYSLMGELLAKNNFVLPTVVPYYGPGNIPFAYPPLGFYFMAFAHHYLNVSTINYLRFIPALFAFLAIFPAFYFIALLTKSKAIACITILFYSIAPIFFDYNLESTGVVRALAHLFTVAGLLLFLLSLKKTSLLFALFSGIFIGLVILSHLTNAVFLIVSVFLLALSEGMSKKKALLAFMALFLGILISSFWWVTMLIRFGPTIFENILNSHGNLSFLKSSCYSYQSNRVFYSNVYRCSTSWISNNIWHRLTNPAKKNFPANLVFFHNHFNE